MAVPSPSPAVLLLLLLLVAAAQAKDGPLILRLESSPEQERPRRQLLGSARMSLFDDLLTKGYYTSRLLIGTPAQEFALIVDTGSTVTYVPCSSCTHCGHHQDPRFSPDSSSSYQALGCGQECPTGSCDGNSHCKYERQYAEMSTSSGVLGKDLVSFGNRSDIGAHQLVFGCETVETGDLYFQRADGIMGLGRGPLSIVDQLVQKKGMADSFSLCYGGMDQGGGAMILGGFEPPPGMVFTHSDPERSPYYNLELKEIMVGGTRVPVKPEVFNSRYGTVLDSGTTYAYLPEAAFTAFTAVVKQKVGALHEIPGPDPNFKDICYAGAGTDVSKLSEHFPGVDFVFGDRKSITLAPENYLFKHSKVSGAYCLGVFKNGKDPTTLLGGIIVRNMLVTYDRANETVGFWKTNCNDLWNRLAASREHSVQPSFLPGVSPAPAPTESPSAERVLPAGAIEIEMLLRMNYSTFSASTSEFLQDIVRALDASIDQVSIVNYTAAGADISVRWAFFPANTVNNEQLNTTAERIISRLKHHEVNLSEAFGIYNLTSWRVIPLARHDVSPRHIVIVSAIVAACILLVSGALLGVYWQFSRHRDKHTYQTLEGAVPQPVEVQMQQL